jgi:flagellin
MSSILTNTGAMVALQTLNGINKNLGKTQDMISTGKNIANAKDNAAVWAISKVMESDVAGFQAISDSLSLGKSSVAVARNAAETTTDLLQDIKSKIVAAQEENVDRAKIQTEIDQLTGQIESVVGAAQFNGLNLVNNSDATSILSSLDRDSQGNVESASIEFRGQDLTTKSGTLETGTALDRIGTVADDGTYTVGAGGTLSNAANDATITIANDLADTDTVTVDFADQQFTFTNNTGAAITVAEFDDILAAGLANLGVEGVTTSVTAVGEVTVSSTNKFDSITIQGSSGSTTFDVDLGAGGLGAGIAATLVARAETVSLGGAGNTGGVVNEGDGFQIALDGQTFNYVAREGDTLNDVAEGLKRVIDAGQIDGISVKVNLSDDVILSPPTIQIDNDNASTVGLAVDDGAGGEASGGLVGLDGIDVSTSERAAAALANIETLIQRSIDSAANFGSVQSRVETQSDFVSKLTDSLKSGIGTLVDADMEEAAARLQALQVQQQLATQALSIANQAPQNILSLFR